MRVIFRDGYKSVFGLCFLRKKKEKERKVKVLWCPRIEAKKSLRR